MTPEMWLELSPHHTRHAQLAVARQNPSEDARCCLASAKFGKPTFYPADNAPPPVLWLGATVGRVGALNFFAGLHFREAAFAASCAQGCLTVVA